MSVKRQATTELNHDNWDQEDQEEQEAGGTFKSASKETLERRVIRTAKRRTLGSSDETKQSVFSGFSGFNKTQPSSFDFLANLTNGNKNANNEISTKTDTSVSYSLFSSKPAMSTPAGIFGTNPSPVKTSLGSATTQATGNLFSTSTNTMASSSVLPAIKADSTVNDSPFKSQPATSTGDTNADVPKLSNTNSTVTPTSQVTSNMFGISSTSGTTTIPGKSLFATTNNTSSLFKTKSTSSPVVSNTNATTNSKNAEKKSEDKSHDKKITYYTKLKGLNESVSDWIKKHVEETPLCLLTPIFKDYEKYLKEIQDEYEGPDKEECKVSDDKVKSQSVPVTLNNNTISASSYTSTGSLVSKNIPPTSKPSIFGVQNNSSSGFSFGNNTSANVTTTATTNTGFTFGNNTSTSVTTTTSAGFTFGITSTSTSTTTTSSPFSFTPNKASNSNAAPPFSFGIGKPFSFSSNITQKVENTEATNDGNDAQDEETPPKVEFTPIAEENSVFDIRCKIFVKKGANFGDKGVGTLYIKKIDDSDKHQLLVRANTTLGNVLLNLRLSSAIPTQRMGKNNVMLVCIPTPDSKPPPTPVLIRVKTSEEADDLLETLNKYKS